MPDQLPSEVLQRNRDLVMKVVDDVLREQSVPGYHGSGSVSWSSKDGVVQADILSERTKKHRPTCDTQ